ncbi:MAG TPA: hypothetical protein VFM10_11300 [Terriglobales bacterium]|nr:hypothetical protein [Terriglobales bacterium]
MLEIPREPMFWLDWMSLDPGFEGSMYRRHRTREKMVLAVRVVGKTTDGKEFDELTHTIDIAVNGARIGGLFRLGLRKGDVIEVRRVQRRAKFRVVWVGEAGTPRYGHVGVQGIDMLPNFWGLELPNTGEAATSIPVQKENPETRAAG